MSSGLVSGIFVITFGGFLVVHCPRAAMREHKSGVGIGRHGSYPRDTMPFRFWITVMGTVAAGLMGAGFVLFGILQLIALGGASL